MPIVSSLWYGCESRPTDKIMPQSASTTDDTSVVTSLLAATVTTILWCSHFFVDHRETMTPSPSQRLTVCKWHSYASGNCFLSQRAATSLHRLHRLHRKTWLLSLRRLSPQMTMAQPNRPKRTHITYMKSYLPVCASSAGRWFVRAHKLTNIIIVII